MLKITRLGEVGNVVIQVEGKLVEPWVRQLEGCWRSVAAQQVGSVRVDLSWVSFIDEAGQHLLKTMHREHVELKAADCYTASLIQSIQRSER